MTHTDDTNIFTVQPLYPVAPDRTYGNCTIERKIIQALDQFRTKLLFFKEKNQYQRSTPSENNDSNSMYGVLGLVAFAICISGSFSVTLLPINNILIYPHYWYEEIFSTSSHSIFTIFSTFQLFT